MNSPISAQCPSCGSPLSEASVVAMAPVCKHCGSVLVNLGGSLGVTGAYGIGDSLLTKRRIEADLHVLEEHRNRYYSAILAHKDQTKWPAEKYAKPIPTPELLPLATCPPVISSTIQGMGAAIVWLLIAGIGGSLVFTFFMAILELGFSVTGNDSTFGFIGGILSIIFLGIATIPPITLTLTPTFRYILTKIQNGKTPKINKERTLQYKKLMEFELKEAEQRKKIEDHRLRTLIAESEALQRVVEDKIVHVQELLRLHSK